MELRIPVPGAVYSCLGFQDFRFGSGLRIRGFGFADLSIWVERFGFEGGKPGSRNAQALNPKP